MRANTPTEAMLCCSLETPATPPAWDSVESVSCRQHPWQRRGGGRAAVLGMQWAPPLGPPLLHACGSVSAAVSAIGKYINSFFEFVQYTYVYFIDRILGPCIYRWNTYLYVRIQMRTYIVRIAFVYVRISYVYRTYTYVYLHYTNVYERYTYAIRAIYVHIRLCTYRNSASCIDLRYTYV